MNRLVVVLAVLIACSSTAEASRRRSVHVPPAAPSDDGSPAAWLATHAFPLRGTELVTDTSDLAPLRVIAGNADIVGLGDGTHGTHEFYTVKLRLIDYLVREMGFEVVSFEASSPLFDQLNAYVLGGAGDPRAMLGAAGQLGYSFWDAEEVLTVVEWMRDYNAHRGAKPPVQIAGADVWDPKGAAGLVVAYLQGADPAAASTAQADYQCVLALTGLFPLGCSQSAAETAYARLAARRSDLGSGSGARAFEEALHNARIVVQSFTFNERDANMAENVRWLHDHRTQAGGGVMYWAHSEHVGKNASNEAPRGGAGFFLKRDLGGAYVAIGTLTGSGQYLIWLGTGPAAFDVPAPEDGTYEQYFRLASPPASIIPLTGAVPQWLSTPARYFIAGIAPSELYLTTSLPDKLDAVIYVHATTPIHALTH